jgi:ATP-binding protein involved in chromosome partitioning
MRSDEGKLALLFNSESPSSKAYINLAMQVAARVSVINYSKYLSKKNLT